MTNPYQPPSKTSDRRSSAPVWYTLFYYVHRPLWFAGVLLAALSWLEIVPELWGWGGVGVVVAVWLGCRLLPRLAGFPTEEFVVLTPEMMARRGRDYRQVMDRFSQGALLVFEETSFAHRPEQEIACAVVSPLPDAELDLPTAQALARQAADVFEELTTGSPEFVAAVADRRLRVSVMSNFGRHSVELCRIVDQQIHWFRPGDAAHS